MGLTKDKLNARLIVTSEKSFTQVGNRQIGAAIKSMNSGEITLRLRIFPGFTYFVEKNWAGFPEYLIFSGRMRTKEGSYKYFHKVGSGYKDPTEDLIEVHMPDLKQSFFIHLSPIDFHFTAHSY